MFRRRLKDIFFKKRKYLQECVYIESFLRKVNRERRVES